MHRYALPISLAVLAAIYVGLRYVMAPPVPASVLVIYMALTAAAIAVFVSASEARLNGFLAPLAAVFEGRAPRAIEVLVLAAIPALIAAGAYSLSAPSRNAPFEARVVHPEPPTTIRSHGKTITIAGLQNPLRTTGPELERRIAQGKTIYFKNCFFCHGDALAGDGHFANAFRPLPANFRDVGTISMLQESFVYWRVATGALGLPKGATPWNSAMPVWQDILSEEEIWKAILYIYSGSGSTPRTWDEEVKHDHKH
ncbi:MAG: cytochrome c [Hyphomicrobiaceae bacterium]|nr:MAG: cytochrome c [Hyphomicrobiaceae bacterium]